MPGKILLAEDDANLRETLTEVFEAEGWEVIAVVNGQAAAELLSNPETAQVIVLDALLPKMNGFDVAKTVRNLGRETPIFFMSGVFRSQEQQREAREKYGCRAYLTKPFDPKHLVDAIRPLLAGDVVAAVAPVAAPQQVQQPQEPLPLLGTLLEYPPLYLLWRAALESHTGVLELFAERERARVFVVKGRAVFAQHSDAQLNVGVELVRDGALTAESYTQACATAIKSSSGLLDVLKSEYGCTEVQTRAAYKALVPKILERVVALSGNFRFVQTDQFSSIVPAASVSIIEPLLSGLRAATVHALDPHVGPRRPLRLAPGDFWGDVVGKLADGCGSESLAKAINGRATSESGVALLGGRTVESRGASSRVASERTRESRSVLARTASRRTRVDRLSLAMFPRRCSAAVRIRGSVSAMNASAAITRSTSAARARCSSAAIR